MQRRTFLASLAATGVATSGFGAELAASWDEAWEQFQQRVLQGRAEADWSALAAELPLDPQLSYLNTGGAGCTPRGLLEQMHATALRLERNPARELWTDGLVREVEAIRVQMYTMWNLQPNELFLADNTTSALAAVGLGIDWQASDEVVLTRHEHLSCHAVWKYLQKRFQLTLRYVEIPLPELSAPLFLQRLSESLTPRTRACCLSHVDSYTGWQLPIREAAALLRERNVLSICDAAQSFGMLDFQPGQLDVDVLVASGHKWLMGPKGTGILYLRAGGQPRARPAVTDWGCSVMTPTTGTRNLPQLYAWSWLLAMRDLLRPAAIEARVRELQQLATRRLRDEIGLQPLGIAADPQAKAGIAAFQLPPQHSVWQVVPRLATEFQVEVKPLPPTCELEPSLQTEHNAFRVSTHVYNSERDIERLIAALQKIL